MIRMPQHPGTREAWDRFDRLSGDRGRETGPRPPGAAVAAGWLPAGHRRDELSRPVPVTERAVIGDELRRPVVWCQLAPCISRYADPEALGEADARARAVAAGWREDRLGRLACPRCQQTREDFWITRPVVQWDRKAAVITTSLMAASMSGDAVGAAGAETGVLPAALPVPRGQAEPAGGALSWPGPAAPPAHARPSWPQAAGPGNGLPARPSAAERTGDQWAGPPAALPGPAGGGRHRRAR